MIEYQENVETVPWRLLTLRGGGIGASISNGLFDEDAFDEVLGGGGRGGALIFEEPKLSKTK